MLTIVSHARKWKKHSQILFIFYDQIFSIISFLFKKQYQKLLILDMLFFVIILSIVCRRNNQKSYHNLLEFFRYMIMVHWLCYSILSVPSKNIWFANFISAPLSITSSHFLQKLRVRTSPFEVFSLNFHNFLINLPLPSIKHTINPSI